MLGIKYSFRHPKKPSSHGTPPSTTLHLDQGYLDGTVRIWDLKAHTMAPFPARFLTFGLLQGNTADSNTHVPPGPVKPPSEGNAH